MEYLGNMSYIKKRDATKTKNFRRVFILGTSYKVITSILLERMNPYTGEIVGDFQYGFRNAKWVFVINNSMIISLN